MGKIEAPPPKVVAPAEPKITGKTAFDVTLTLAKGEYPGMCLDMSEGAWLRVSKIDRRGPIPDYNASAPEDEQVREGMFIVAVDSVNGDGREMMTALFNGGTPTLSFRQPHSFNIGPVRKQGNSLGLDLTYQARSSSVVIKQLFP